MNSQDEQYAGTDGRRAVENNILRHEYRILTDEETKRILDLKTLGDEFIQACSAAGVSREISLAKTKIEEAVMWAVKGVTA